MIIIQSYISMKEEQIIAHFGKKNPFKTPDGYFEGLTSRVMSQIPENEVVMTPRHRSKIWMYVAASFCGLLVLGTLISQTVTTDSKMPMELAQENNQLEDSSYLEDMVDYALISDAMIYYEYMSDEE